MHKVEIRYPEVDLHCHTTASDGLLTPWELVKSAADIGLKAIAITDHDTISGWEEAEKAGKIFGVEIIKGVELNTDWSGVEVHILGYEIDPSKTVLQDKLRELREARQIRIFKMIKKLQELGIPISKSEVEEGSRGESIGRPHIAQILVEKGIVSSQGEAFDRFLVPGAPAFVPRMKITPEEGIRLIRQGGGVAVLAHPGIHSVEKGLPQWIKAGLQGIEVSHSEHSPAQEKKYKELAKKYGLLMTGGSDFHGEDRKPGVSLGKWGTSYNVVEELKKLAQMQHV